MTLTPLALKFFNLHSYSLREVTCVVTLNHTHGRTYQNSELPAVPEDMTGSAKIWNEKEVF